MDPTIAAAGRPTRDEAGQSGRGDQVATVVTEPAAEQRPSDKGGAGGAIARPAIARGVAMEAAQDVGARTTPDETATGDVEAARTGASDGPAARSEAAAPEPPARPAAPATSDVQIDRPMAVELPGSDGSAPLREISTTDFRGGDSRPLTETALPRPELARTAAGQIAEVAGGLSDGSVEISLSPEELGKVRLSLQGGEGQMTVQIMAERPETLDLLRRHIDMLAAELRQQGYSDLAFSFGGGGFGDGKQRPGTAPRPDAPAELGGVATTAFAAAPGPTPRAPAGALDLRL